MWENANARRALVTRALPGRRFPLACRADDPIGNIKIDSFGYGEALECMGKPHVDLMFYCMLYKPYVQYSYEHWPSNVVGKGILYKSTPFSPLSAGKCSSF